ncbi:acyl-CoA N-acyltransferase [Halteromyces radiatus]|uniref:acyl-CoA N-acyltransferase n=1 Tax=Halteromyces radiatus TaxID=101107 RepID=UPI00221EACC7|nr:acyl-CoA N-acyltransferase [Halteromyces radiatus]KAI8079982.1 acyl-CoA N-acyltransferase [Halteromyces radiatus]
MTSSLTFSAATLDDLDILIDLETRSYAPDEAASPENLKRRILAAQQTNHPELLFMVARRQENPEEQKDVTTSLTIVGFICCTVATSDLVTEESMSDNQPEGQTVCLHSVCVSPDTRHQGIATALLTRWVGLHRQIRAYKRLALLSRPHLVALYSSVGFKEIGISKVVHGPEPWVDCVLDL